MCCKSLPTYQRVVNFARIGLDLGSLGTPKGRWDIVDRRGDQTKLRDCALGASGSVTWKRVNAG